MFELASNRSGLSCENGDDDDGTIVSIEGATTNVTVDLFRRGMTFAEVVPDSAFLSAGFPMWSCFGELVALGTNLRLPFPLETIRESDIINQRKEKKKTQS